MSVPCYPDFVPLDIELKDAMHPRLSLTADGVSEFTFSGLYLFRNRYDYRISRNTAHSSGEEGGFIISGKQNGKTFFSTPCEAPNDEIPGIAF